MRQHALSVYERSGILPAVLANAPKCPEGCEDTWRAFLDMRASASSGIGPARISFAEMDAFQRVTGKRLASWQVDAIRRADAAFTEGKPRD